MPQTANKPKTGDGIMGLGEHLDELRSRLIRAIAGLVPLVAIGLYFGEEILRFMVAPVQAALKAEGQDVRLLQTGPLDAFTAYFYVALIGALAVGAPWAVYQLWKFVAPGLYAHEKRFAYLLAPLSLVLSIAGFCVMRFGMMPLAMAFFVHFGSTLLSTPMTIEPLPAGVTLASIPVLDADPPAPTPGQMWVNAERHELRVCVAAPRDGAGAEVRGVALTRTSTIRQDYRVNEYVDLFLQLTFIFIIAFQLPVVVLLLGWAGIVTPEWLGKYRKYALAIAVVGSAVVSPTGDVLSLAMLQIPLYLLYELGILLLRIFPASRLAGKREGEDDEDDEQRGAPAALPPGAPPSDGPADGP